MPASNLTRFDAASPRLWERPDMAKISQLPLVTNPDGTETFVVLKDGMAQRVPGAALIGAAGDVSLEQVQAAAAQAANAQEAQGAAQSAAQAASAAQTLADAASTKADATAAALAALVLPRPALT
jgi:hypothetical protein